jgi:hypothetical protein
MSCPFIPLDLITLIIFGGAYKLRSSSSCSVLQPPATSSFLPSDMEDGFEYIE